MWQFLVDPEKRKLWFCGGATGEGPEADIVFEFDHRRLSESGPHEKYATEEVVTHCGKILEYAPLKRLAFTWFESAGAQSSTVEIDLASNADGRTQLKLIHTGVEGREMLVGVLAGRHGHFDLMAETMLGDRVTDFWVRDQALEAEYETLV